MESNNLHHLHQDQPPLLEASSLTTPSSYGSSHGGTSVSHSWTPNITLNNADNNFINQNLQEANPRSRALMIQDLGYHHHYHQWTSDAESCLEPKFSEMLNSTTTPSNMEGYHNNCLHSTSIVTNQNINEHKDMNALNDKLLFRTIFSGDMYSTSAQNYANFGGTTTTTTGAGIPISRGNFSQIYPSINISNLNHSSSTTTTTSTPISSSLNILSTTQPLDLLTSPTSLTPGLGLSHHHHHHHRSQDHVLGSDNISFSLDHMHHPTPDRSSCNNSSNLSHFTNGAAETKRPSILMESKTSSQSQTTSKKSRMESRPSCSPIKVRKEKLGDRIAALQHLVAPFGKTDTASVLMEAIGYIKFLQGQVETLSVPYMKSSQNQNNRVMQGGSGISDGNGEPKQDLRSRGLCLVPLSCMSYIAGDGGTEVWQHPNFHGPT